MIVAAGRDDTSILITLTARHLNPTLPISVVVRNEDNELPARAAGATTVINPVSFAGLLLATACTGPRVTDALVDLAGIGGEVTLVERPVARDELGSPLSAIRTGLGLRIYREGRRLGFDDPSVAVLEPGDTIVEIVSTKKA